MAELLEKIPVEKCWAITAKNLQRFLVMRGSRILPSVLDTEEGFISPVRGWEKTEEITDKIYGEVAGRLFQMVKETLNLSVEDAIGAAKLFIAATTLLWGPESKSEIIEESKERVVLRYKCLWPSIYDDLEVDKEFRACKTAHQAWGDEGFEAISPKITYKLRKALPWVDAYCEGVIEFNKE